jgi:hypothetical protein
MAGRRSSRVQLPKELTRFLAVDPDTVETSEPLIRDLTETLRDRTSIVLQSAGRELTESERGDLENAAKPHWAFVDGFNHLPLGSVWDLTDENVELWRRHGEPRQVWIRWDVLTPAQRKVATSAATFLVGILQGTGRTGRPRGSRLQPAEQRVVEALGERMWSIPWREVVEAMVKAGAWQARPEPQRDAKEWRALRARWKRLMERVREVRKDKVTAKAD